MTSQKISQFTAITVLSSGDYFPVVQASGTTNKRVGVDILDVRYTSAASGSAAFAAAATAQASGNAALINAATAQASGNAALASAATAQASGNAALSNLAGKYDKTGGPITGFVATQKQVVSVISGPVLVSGAIQLDLSQSNNWELVLGGTTTLLNPASASGGQCGAITIRQDNVGSRLLSYSGNWNFAGGSAPTLTTAASGVDVLAFYCTSPSEVQVVSNLNFS